MNKEKAKVLNLIIPIATVGLIVAVWGVASAIIDSEFILPSISNTLNQFFNLLLSREFYLSFFHTVLRSLIAFAVSFMLAFIFSVLRQKIIILKGVFDTFMSITRALPTIAVILLILFWTNSKVAPIIVTVLVVLPTTYTHFVNALNSLDKTVSEASRVDGANEKSVLIKIELPQALPSIYMAIGSGISLTFKLMVAAEVIAQTANSIGFMLNTSKVYFEIAEMTALVVASVIFGVIVETIFNFLSKKAGSFKE